MARPCVAAHTRRAMSLTQVVWGSAVLGNEGAEQTVVFIDHNLVTLADLGFQAFAVQYRDSAADILDQSFFLQMVSGYRNAFASYAEHVGDQFMRHYQLIGLELIVIDKQPAAKLLFDAMEPVADGRLRYLRHEGLGIAEQDALKNTSQ